MTRRKDPSEPPVFDEVLADRLARGLVHDTETGALVPVGRRKLEFAAAVRALAARGLSDLAVADHFTSNGLAMTDRRIHRIRSLHKIPASGAGHHRYTRDLIHAGGTWAPVSTR